jgi:hypothetical protein
MSQAENPNTTITPWRLLAAMFRDPFVADAFRRAERGPDAAFATVDPRPTVLSGGATEQAPGEAGGHVCDVLNHWQAGFTDGLAGYRTAARGSLAYALGLAEGRRRRAQMLEAVRWPTPC